MVCIGICDQYPPKKIDRRWYVGDNKRCQHCGKYISWSGGLVKTWSKDEGKYLSIYVPYTNCPCCRQKVRLHARKIKYQYKMDLLHK